MPAVQTLSLQISDNASQAATNIDKLTDSLRKLQNAISGNSLGKLASQLTSMAKTAGISQYLDRIAQAVERTNTLIVGLATSLNTLMTTMSGTGTGMSSFSSGLQSSVNSATTALNNLTHAMTTTSGAASKMKKAVTAATKFKDVHESLAAFANQVKQFSQGWAYAAAPAVAAAASNLNFMATSMNALSYTPVNVAKSMDAMDASLKPATESVNIAAMAFEELKAVMAGVVSRIGGVISSFARIARMRLFRYIIRQVTTAFREGLENVRAYSKAIDGLYNKDMTNLDNSVLKLKNSLGAALAPAIQALLPTIQQLISYVIQAANAFNQFVSILNGRGQWTRAIDVVASDFENAENSANGAAKAAKNLLASWDELNIIQSQASGGGSGSNRLTDADYMRMFTEEFTFDNDVVRFVNFLKDNLPIVNGFVAALAAWLLGIKMWGVAAIVGITVTLSSAEDIIKNGLNANNLRDSLVGALASMAAGAMLGWTLGGPGGLVLGTIIGFGITASITLFADYLHNLKVGDVGDAIADALGLVATTTGLGAAAGAAFGNMWLGAIVGFVVGAAVSLITWFTVDTGSAKKGVALSEEEIQEYVSSNMFSSDVNVTINILNTTVENVENARKAIAKRVGTISVTLGRLKIGVNKQDAYNDLLDEIFGPVGADGETRSGGLIGEVQAYAKDQTTLLRTNFSLMPVMSNGQDVTAEALLFGESGWDIITTDMYNMGKDLSEQISLGFTDNVANFDEEAVMAMTQEIIELNAAMAHAQMVSEAQTELVTNLANGMEYTEAFATYSSRLYDAALTSRMATAGSYTSQSAYYRKKAEWHPEQADYWNGLADKADEWAASIISTAVSDANSFRNESASTGIAILVQYAGKPWETQSGGFSAYATEVLDNKSGWFHYNPIPDYDYLIAKVIQDMYGENAYGAFTGAGYNIRDFIPEGVLGEIDAIMQTRKNPYEWDSGALQLPAFGLYAPPNAYEETDNVVIDASNGTVSVDAPVVSSSGTGVAIGDTNESNSRYKTMREHYAEEGTGTKQDIREQVVLERQMVDLLRQLLNKQWTTQVSPSAGLGRVMAQAQEMWNKASGSAG